MTFILYIHTYIHTFPSPQNKFTLYYPFLLTSVFTAKTCFNLAFSAFRSAAVFFKPFIFRVCNFSMFCLPIWIRPCVVPKPSVDMFFFLVTFSSLGLRQASFMRSSSGSLVRLRVKSTRGPKNI